MLKSEVKVSLFHFEKAKAALTCIVTDEKQSSEVWLAYIHILNYLDPWLFGIILSSPNKSG